MLTANILTYTTRTTNTTATIGKLTLLLLYARRAITYYSSYYRSLIMRIATPFFILGVFSSSYTHITDASAACEYSYGATLETWTGIEGDYISNLTTATDNLSTPPHSSVRLGSILEAPSKIDDNYGQRIKGWLVAPETGFYTFWIASDDEGQLYLSSDDDPANKDLIANVPGGGGTDSRQWDKYPAQQSAQISLIAGSAYYMEALMKAGTRDDNLDLAWSYASQAQQVIPAVHMRMENPYGATLETWMNIGGKHISNLTTATNNLSTPPDSSVRLGSILEAPTSIDNEGQLYLSSDGNPANKVLIANVPRDGATNPRQWDKYPAQQQSTEISLIAGSAYYMEALMKE
eukprot:scaffold27489_cov133-Skeletonema_dohrnii-CCMP3373.AAC.1